MYLPVCKMAQSRKQLVLRIVLCVQTLVCLFSATSGANICAENEVTPQRLTLCTTDGAATERDEDCLSPREAVCHRQCVSSDYPVFADSRYYDLDRLSQLLLPNEERLTGSGGGVCVTERECLFLTPNVKYGPLVPNSSWLCHAHCLPIHLSCDGVCSIHLFLKRREEQRQREARLGFGGRSRGRRGRRGRSRGLGSSRVSVRTGGRSSVNRRTSKAFNDEITFKPVYCHMDQYFPGFESGGKSGGESANRTVSQICLTSGMSCNDTCSWDKVFKSGSGGPLKEKTLSLFDHGKNETVCVSYCDRVNEWQCGDRCVDKETPCGEPRSLDKDHYSSDNGTTSDEDDDNNLRCSRDYFLCKREERCIPLRWVCDGSSRLGCLDGSDEQDCDGCADGQRRCGDRVLCKTRGLNRPCDGLCGLGYEKCSEELCVTHRQSCNGTCLREGMLSCGYECYEVNERCDGTTQCGNGDDEKECGECSVGSRMCGKRVICATDHCALDQKDVDGDVDVDDTTSADGEAVTSCNEPKCAKTEKECEAFCDHYWCRTEARCLSRNDQLQSCSDLASFPSIDAAIFTNVTGPKCDGGLWDLSSSGEDGRGSSSGSSVDDGDQVFKQASCIPDTNGACPSSIRVSDRVTKLWIKCGQACWKKNVFHEPKGIPQRYRLQPGETSLSKSPKCHQESFDALCRARCKYYDAWFCDDQLICTDQPCHGRCPSVAGPKEERFYLCNGLCIPESAACGVKCPKGRFRCDSKCLSPKQVCDGKNDCYNREDERPSFCLGCRVGQTLCGQRPICVDQKCQGHCVTLRDDLDLGLDADLNADAGTDAGHTFVDCGFEGGDRNICADRISSCDRWMERRYGPRFLL